GSASRRARLPRAPAAKAPSGSRWYVRPIPSRYPGHIPGCDRARRRDTQPTRRSPGTLSIGPELGPEIAGGRPSASEETPFLRNDARTVQVDKICHFVFIEKVVERVRALLELEAHLVLVDRDDTEESDASPIAEFERVELLRRQQRICDQRTAEFRAISVWLWRIAVWDRVAIPQER